jgi:hypothetical protein
VKDKIKIFYFHKKSMIAFILAFEILIVFLVANRNLCDSNESLLPINLSSDNTY